MYKRQLQEEMEIFMRKHYLDNIRFLTIFFVVIFHVYFYYNNIGTEAMFAGLKPYEGAVTFAGICLLYTSFQ